jgi:hypothetical protein
MHIKVYFSLIFSLLLAGSIYSQSTKIIPEKLVKGTEFEIQYNPDGGDLADKKINCNLFIFGADYEPVVREVEMEMKDGYWSTTAKLTENDHLICYLFYDRNDDDVIDNNKKAGYVSAVYNVDGSASAGIYMSKGNLYGRSSYRIVVDYDVAKSAKKYG